MPNGKGRGARLAGCLAAARIGLCPLPAAANLTSLRTLATVEQK